MTGEKHDKGKPRWSLLPFAAVGEIVKVLSYGAEKYAENNWMSVEPFEGRYISALLRHVAAYGDGEDRDPETGLYHLAHGGACILFLIWKHLQDDTRK